MLGVSTVSTIKTMGGCDKVMSWWLVRVFSSFYIIYIYIFFNRYCYYYYYLVSSLSLFISIIILIRLQGCFRRSQNRWFVRTPIPQMLGLHPKWGEIWIQCFSCKKKLLDSAKRITTWKRAQGHWGAPACAHVQLCQSNFLKCCAGLLILLALFVHLTCTVATFSSGSHFLATAIILFSCHPCFAATPVHHVMYHALEAAKNHILKHYGQYHAVDIEEGAATSSDCRWWLFRWRAKSPSRSSSKSRATSRKAIGMPSWQSECRRATSLSTAPWQLRWTGQVADCGGRRRRRMPCAEVLSFEPWHPHRPGTGLVRQRSLAHWLQDGPQFASRQSGFHEAAVEHSRTAVADPRHPCQAWPCIWDAQADCGRKMGAYGRSTPRGHGIHQSQRILVQCEQPAIPVGASECLR